MQRRIVSLWFEHLPIERVLRRGHSEGAFALYFRERNTDRLYAINMVARKSGLSEGMGLGDARTFCPRLIAKPANLSADQRFLRGLARLSQRFCPWVGVEGADGLLLDMTGSTHLWGGEAGFSHQAKTYFCSLGLSVSIGMAPTIGAAWALSHFSEGATDDPRDALRELPIEALRLGTESALTLKRFGLNNIGALYNMPRAELTRRSGQEPLLRLDQALGAVAETLSPIGPPQIFATRMKFPEPIGLLDDVMEAIRRLLEPLCQKLDNFGFAAHGLMISLARIDKHDEQVSLRFARPLSDAKTILPLIRYQIEPIDAGFGFDGVRLEACEIEKHTHEAIEAIGGSDHSQGFDDLLTRIGNRIGFENIQKLVPIDSHLPDKSFALVRYDTEISNLPKAKICDKPRPITLFHPEKIHAQGAAPPQRFTWRRMKFRMARAIGPERIAPEWWRDDENWKTGIRDYWRVATFEGRRLWLFYTPQNPAWYVHGEFA